MKKLLLLLLFCHVSSPVKHSLDFSVMASRGVPNIPDFVAVTHIEDVIMAYYDSSLAAPQPRQDWVRKLTEEDPQHWKRAVQECRNYQHHFKAEADTFKLHLNRTGGVHIIQESFGCEWDGETEKVDGYNQYGYNGENFLVLDVETETWVAVDPQAELIKSSLNTHWKNFLTNECPKWLKKYLKDGESFLQRAELPSVSLLQKTPSSPVSCHASGFYPDRASLIWRKDGEELHEGVDLGEILPNHDGTFQMSADLKPSASEDWGKYECVFHLSGVKDDVVTRLDQAEIRTNWVKTSVRGDEGGPGNIGISVTAAVLVLAAVAVAAVGFSVYKKKKAAADSAELSETLNPDA
ncbi:major histocompatibility complex class I-related gene protein-like isoform X2 [Chelmon rostratus]|uniref:major histocompatibility complex class I-related gene protein-like isoform X2 n=1 Tax=Chelmon rostratus TaxID=109905 RepID=UPI001BEB11B2|nr:major histocompatibility complex class I-related gene protein-like isoform X2 [Chelmon rostratus]